MSTGKTRKILLLFLVMFVLIALLVAVLEVVPLKKAYEAYGPLDLIATPQGAATTTIEVKQGWQVSGTLSVGDSNFPNLVWFYIFEPDGKTLVLSKTYDLQHNLSGYQSETSFNFTANVQGNYVFLLNGTFLSVPPPPYEFQPKVTMTMFVFETGKIPIL